MLHTFLASTTTLLLVGLSLTGCQSDQTLEPVSLPDDCLVSGSAANGQAIAGQYILTTRMSATSSLPSARQWHSALIQALLTSNGVADPRAEQLVGTNAETTFLTHLQPDEAELILTNPVVLRLEPDRIVSVCACVDVAEPTTLPWNVQQTGYGRGDLNRTKRFG